MDGIIFFLLGALIMIGASMAYCAMTLEEILRELKKMNNK